LGNGLGIPWITAACGLDVVSLGLLDRLATKLRKEFLGRYERYQQYNKCGSE